MHRSRRLVLICVLAVMVGVGGFAAWKLLSPDAPGPERRLSIGLVTWIGYGPVHIAQARGYFRDEGIDVDVHVLDTPGQREAAFASRSIDLFPNTPDAFAIMAASGQSAGPVIMALDRSVGGDGIVVNESIRQWSDLSGRTVGYQKGITSHFLFLWLLERHGVPEQSVRQQSLDAGQAGAAFVAGRLDAAVTWEPWLTQVAQSRRGRVLATSAEAPYLLADVLMVQPEVLARRPEDLRAFMRAWYRAVQYMRQQPADSARILGQALGVPPGEIGGMLRTVRFFTPTEAASYLDGSMPDQSFGGIFQTSIRLYKRAGVINQAANPRIAVDTTLLRTITGG